MAWSGKVLGGLVGGMMGGPLGAGVGAALGHYFADGEPAEKSRELVVSRLLWRHHAFGPSGPGVRLTPVWRARKHLGKDVRVRLDAGPHRFSVVVVPEADDELCEIPEFVVPYADFEGKVRVRLDSVRTAAEPSDFEIELPTPVRRLGSSGPARLVMALVASARAGGRPLTKDDVRFIRESFSAANPLDDDGVVWLREWLRELRAADLARLTPEKVAKRLAPHLTDVDATEDTLLWLMRGARDVWPGGAAEAWIAGFGGALGLDATRISALWSELERGGDDATEAHARKVLGVGPDATEDEIRAAWRRLVHRWHPDRAQADVAEATRRVSEINAAWRVLRG